jgi:predicted ATPase/class 3 adenylate cyclase
MNPDDQRPKREQLEQAIAAQEGLRGTLDDAIIEATIAALRKQLAELEPTPEVEQQRKLATVLFMDVVNSTQMLSELDPEENLAFMDRALQRLADPVEARGGRVTRFMGDGYLAIFGLPRSHENDPEMAIRAGLGIIETAEVIARELEVEHQLQGFQVRVGINTGLIVAGGVTEAEGTIMGAAVNLAARLEDSAPPGGVLISQHTYQHVRGIFDFEPVEVIQVKGFEQPVQVYLVLMAKPRTFRTFTRGVEGVETSLVGRQLEMNTLQEAYNQVIEKVESRFVTIVGDAGLGKSRLLEEFESWMYRSSGDRVVLIKGRATSETKTLPYALFRDLIAHRFEILDDDPADLAREKIVAGFKSTLGSSVDPEINAHFVGQMLGYDFSDSHFLEGVLDAPRQLHDRALVYMSNYLKALAVENPLVFFLDDVHWADESSLDILLHLSKELAGEQILFIALTRPLLYQRRTSWGEESYHLRIDLHPLSNEDSQLLVEEVLQKVLDIPAELRDLIVRNAEGNPFYLEELIKMLVEDDVIVKDEPAWRVHPERLGEVRIPPTLTGVVQARLDGLPVAERTVIQQASVIGRIFWEAAVDYINREIVTDQERDPTKAIDLLQNLDKLRDREMVFLREASAFSDSVEYIFKHAILREVTYESVLKRTRREYHGMVADWLIEYSGGRTEQFSPLIAGHLEKASRMDEALDYLFKAAETAASNYAVDEAADFYQRALDLAPIDDLDRRYTILLGRELVSGMRGDRITQREALQGLDEIVELLGDDHKKAVILIRKAWYGYWTGEYVEAQQAATQAVNLAEAVREQELLLEADYALAWSYLQHSDSDQALIHAREALPLARQSGRRRDEGNILNILGMISIAEGDYFQASGYLKDFLSIARQIDDRERESTALNNLGVAMTILGHYQAAQSYFQQYLNIALEMGDKVSEGTSSINMAWVSSSMGEWEMAIKHGEEGIAKKREQAQVEAVAEGLIWMGHAWLGLDQPGKAIPAYQESLAIRRELDQPHLAMGVLAGLARAELARGEAGSAWSHVEEVIAYLDSGGNLRGTWEPIRIYLTCYQVLERVENQRAGAFLEDAFSILQERAERIPDEDERRRYLEVVPWHRELVAEWEARRTSDNLTPKNGPN